jgi:hypothetical protein
MAEDSSAMRAKTKSQSSRPLADARKPQHRESEPAGKLGLACVTTIPNHVRVASSMSPAGLTKSAGNPQCLVIPFIP